MEYRNLKRFLLTSKTLKKHNKTAPFEITQKRLSLLLTILLMDEQGIKTTVKNIQLKLTDIGRSDGWLNILSNVTLLTENNLLTKVGSYYYLTTEARLLLSHLESKLRVERFNR